MCFAAGALATPLILMNSKSPEWPEQLGNNNDLVGRGLMFHVGQTFVMRTPRARPAAGPAKSMSSRTFNKVGGKRLGGVQSFTGRVKVGQIANYIVDLIESEIPFQSMERVSARSRSRR